MQVLMAEHSGFCAGVRRAMKIAAEAFDSQEDWYTLGDLVHNRFVAQYLQERGISVLDSLEEAASGGIIIRSHGVPPETVREIKRRGFSMKDATCPLVKRVYEKAAFLNNGGYDVVVFGDRDHPEVKGICGWIDYQATVISNIEEALQLDGAVKRGLVAQTTSDEDAFFDIARALLPGCEELCVINTICGATRKRQTGAREVAARVDIMVVVGDRKSSNTRVLLEKCQATGVRSLLVECTDELKAEEFNNVSRVGVTAGASTPDWIIKEVVNWMEELKDNGLESLENQASPENPEIQAGPEAEEVIVSSPAETEEANAPAPAETEEANAPAPAEENFAALEAEMAEMAIPSRGEIVTGTVIQVLNDEVMVDVGGKSEGIIPLKELSLQELNSALDFVKVGDKIEVLVLKWDDDGTILLSKKRVDQSRIMDRLEERFNNNETIEGKIEGSVKGGLLVDLEGITAFLPASHVDNTYVKNIDDYIGRTMDFKVIEFNRNKRRGSQVVLSRRELAEAEKNQRKEAFWSAIEENQIFNGRVKRIVDYGAFIDIGGYEGLLHVSEIDHNRVEHPSDVLTEGQELEVAVIALDRAKERISLSRKKLLKSPWEIVTDKYQEGDIIDGTVARIAPFGAFVEIEPGVDGLVHISQLANRRVAKPEDVVSINQQIRVKILSIDHEEKKIALSLKAVEAAEEQAQVDEYMAEQENSEE